MDAGGSEADGAGREGALISGASAFDGEFLIDDAPLGGAVYVGTPSASGGSVLRKNLAAIGRTCAHAAELIERAAPRDDIVFVETDDDSDQGKVLSATIGVGDEVRSLASRRRPLAEAERFARGFDPGKKGAVAVLGFGVGHHVGAVARPDPSAVVPAVSKEPQAVARGREGSLVSPDSKAEAGGANSIGVSSRGEVRRERHGPSAPWCSWSRRAEPSNHAW